MSKARQFGQTRLRSSSPFSDEENGVDAFTNDRGYLTLYHDRDTIILDPGEVRHLVELLGAEVDRGS